MGTKLHELIAVENDVKKTGARMILETQTTLTKKQQLFTGHSRVYQPLTEGQETFDEEVSHVVTNVPEKLAYFQNHIIRMLDVIYQKEKANTQACADIVISQDDGDDIVLAEKVPVQTLVQFEKHLESVRSQVYNAIPTLDPKNNWYPDEQRGSGFYKTNETKKRKTVKQETSEVVVQATKEFPAQVRDRVKDVQVGHWVEVSFSGMMTPADKSILLERVGELIEAVKKARARANQQEVGKEKIAQRLFKYINTGE